MKQPYRRLFVGLPLSAALTKRLAREQALWPDEPLLKTRPENLHVTLFFLGFILEEELYGIAERLRDSVAGLESFELSFDAIKMADPAAPKMIWLTGQPNAALLALRQALEDTFTSLAPEKKSFRPHVTLAKIKRAKWLALPETPTIERSVNLVEPVSEVVLYESLVIDGKRTYEAIDHFPLA